MRLLWVWSVTRGAGPGWGGCDDPSGARVERGGSAQAGADDALTETRCGAGPPCADYPARGGGDERAGDRGQDGPMRRHGAFLAQALQRARPARAGGGDALGASADLHRRGAQRCYRRGAVAARRVGPAVRVVDPGPLGGLLGREGHRHEAQPDERGSPRRGAEVAPGRDLVRGAGGPGVRAQKISWALDGRAGEVWWSSPLADTGERPCPPTPILPRSRSAPTRSSSPLS